jgi:hypothetical protein
VELFFKWIKQRLRIKQFYGDVGERGKDANFDRRVGLRAGGDRQKAARFGGIVLHISNRPTTSGTPSIVNSD